MDISQTQISAENVRAVANPDGYGLELDIQGVLQNNCGSAVSNVHYNMNVQLDCPSGSYDPGITEPFNFNSDYASFPPGGPYSATSSAREWIYTCYVGGGKGGVQGAVIPNAIEVSGFATGVDANVNAVQSQNIDKTLYKPS